MYFCAVPFHVFQVSVSASLAPKTTTILQPAVRLEMVGAGSLMDWHN
jgi:hypothetical protein